MAVFSAKWKRENHSDIKLYERTLQNIAFAEAPAGKLLRVKVRDIGQGRANKHWISIPLWTIVFGHYYGLWYVLHEIAHYYYKDQGHTDAFKKVEADLCLKHGLTLVRSRAYPKEIYHHGKLVFSKKKQWKKVWDYLKPPNKMERRISDVYARGMEGKL